MNGPTPIRFIVCAAMVFMACMNGDVPQDSKESMRARMVSNQIEARDISDPLLLDAMRKVPRHLFVPVSYRDMAYADHPLPIGYDQTISQPYIVAFMTDALKLKPDYKVLEIGTGSGYQAAILAELVRKVYTIEILRPLGERAKKLLLDLGYDNIETRIGDGYRGWPKAAPFDAIIVTAAPDHIPSALVEQLKVGGRLVIPVGRFFQELLLIIKTPDGIEQKSILPVSFVPMTGEAQDG